MEPDVVLPNGGQIVGTTEAVSSGSRNASGSTPTSANALSSDFETFIRMLTVQMRNQDPLNPIESADFAVQLATFSSVEQQVRTNDLLISLADQFGAQNLSQLSGWVGMEARAIMPVEFEGTPVRLTMQPDSLADGGRLVVRNSRNDVVQTLDIPPGRQVVEWSGFSGDDTPLPWGRYDLTLESLSDGNVIATGPVEVHGTIAEARNTTEGAVLVMQGGQQVLAQDVLALRQPEN